MGNNESRIDFSQQLGTLNQKDVASSDHEFWKVLFLSELTVEDVFTRVTPGDVRKLRRDRPANLARMMFKCIQQLSLFVSQAAKGEKDFTSARNSLRILSRVLPAVFEADAPSGERPQSQKEARQLPISKFATEFFWANRVTGANGEVEQMPKMEAEGQNDRPLGELLMDSLMRICFRPGFTLHNTRKLNEEPDNEKAANCYFPDIERSELWVCGVAAPHLAGTGMKQAELEQNRSDALRCILAACSETLYTDDPLRPNRFIHCLMTGRNHRNAIKLFYSLMNTVANFDPKGTLPYTSWVGGLGAETVLDMSLHLLLIGLDYSSFADIMHQRSITLNQARKTAHTAQIQGTNTAPNPSRPALDPADVGRLKTMDGQIKQRVEQQGFWAALHNLKADTDFQYLFHRITGLLKNPLEAQQTWMPHSQKSIQCQFELVLLLWKMVESNNAFKMFVVRQPRLEELIVPLTFIMCEARRPADFGILQVAVFIVLSLSGEREFCVTLNRPFTQAGLLSSALPPIGGSLCDLLLVVIHNLMTSAQSHLKPLYDAFVTIIANIAPYLKKVNQLASDKLVALFVQLAEPKFMIKHDMKPLPLVGYLVEAFNSLIQYQYNGSAHLIYSMLTHYRSFEKLHYLAKTGMPITTKELNLKEQKDRAARKGIHFPAMQAQAPPAEAQQQRAGYQAQPTPAPEAEAKEGEKKKEGGEAPEAQQPSSPSSGAAQPPPSSAGGITPKADEVELTLSAVSDVVHPHQAPQLPTDQAARAEKVCRLPLFTTLKTLEVLKPICDNFSMDNNKTPDEVVNHIQERTLVGILPVPHAISMRKFTSEITTHAWTTTTIWGLVYWRNRDPSDLFDPEAIKLFKLWQKEQPEGQKPSESPKGAAAGAGAGAGAGAKPTPKPTATSAEAPTLQPAGGEAEERARAAPVNTTTASLSTAA